MTRTRLVVAGLAALLLAGAGEALAFVSGNTIDGHATYTQDGARVRATGPIGRRSTTSPRASRSRSPPRHPPEERRFNAAFYRAAGEHRLSWIAVILMLLSLPLIAIHEPPFGPVGLAIFVVAAVLLLVRGQSSVAAEPA